MHRYCSDDQCRVETECIGFGLARRHHLVDGRRILAEGHTALSGVVTLVEGLSV